MGGMLATRFATQYPDMTERLVLYNPIGLVDGRYARPWTSTDEAYKQTLASTYQTNYTAISRYFSHSPTAWKPEYDRYVRIRYAWTLSGDWPRYAMVQTLLTQVQYADPVVYDWPTSRRRRCARWSEDSLTPGFRKHESACHIRFRAARRACI